MATEIKLRQDTQDNWDSATVTPVQGEVCLVYDDTDTDKLLGLKIGDGATEWESLPFHVPVMEGIPNQLEDAGGAVPTGTPVNDTTTFLLKGLTGQTEKVFGIEEAGDGTTLKFWVDKDGQIGTDGDVSFAGDVVVGGGHGDTGTTLSDTGNINSDGVIQSGTYHTSGEDSGAQLKDNTDHGQLLISSTDAADLTDVAIKVNTAAGGVADKFIVTHGGAISTVDAITSTGIVTTQGIVNSAAVINAGSQKVTNVTTPEADTDAATKGYVDGMSYIGSGTLGSSYLRTPDLSDYVNVYISFNAATSSGTLGGGATRDIVFRVTDTGDSVSSLTIFPARNSYTGLTNWYSLSSDEIGYHTYTVRGFLSISGISKSDLDVGSWVVAGGHSAFNNSVAAGSFLYGAIAGIKYVDIAVAGTYSSPAIGTTSGEMEVYGLKR